MRICPKCNEEYNESFGACPYCGKINPNPTTEDAHTEQQDPPPVPAEEQYNDSFDTPKEEASYSSSNSAGEINENFSGSNKKRKIIITVSSIIAAVIIALFILFGTGVIKTSDLGLDDSNSSAAQTTLPNGNTAPTLPNGDPIYQTTPNGEVATNASGEPITLASNSGGASENDSSQNPSSSSANNNASSKQSSSSNSNNSSSGSSTSSKPSSGKTVNINGTAFSVGDKITVNVYFKEPAKTMQAIDASLFYKDDVLEYVKDSCKFPVMGNAVVNDEKLKNEILFNNATAVGFLDFSNEGILISCQFTVKDTGATSTDVTFSVNKALRDPDNSTTFEQLTEDDYSVRIEVK